MAHLNIEKISLSSKDREKEEQKRVHRRKTALVLIYHYLKDYGYIQAAGVLKTEVNFNPEEYTICDNVHLESLIQDYESYYFLKYQKLPQIMKKIPAGYQIKPISKLRNIPYKSKFYKDLKLSNRMRSSSVDQISKKTDKNAVQNFPVMQNSSDKLRNIYEEAGKSMLEAFGSFDNYSSDWKSMAELILQDTHDLKTSIQWNDVIGHERAKELIKEAIVYPMKYPELFSSQLSPWRSFLLYGPSGTGKTLLASAAASESGVKFFRLCVSTLISKWRGESEKLIKVLFDLAKHYAPAIIFLDEIDALMSHRGDDHEASRRMKTELFLQLDGLFTTDKLVLVLSATNMPWQLDYAILRRLEKRILIPLPDGECRECLFRKFLPQSMDIVGRFKMKTELDFTKLAQITENYSAADIETVCKEAKMNYIRQAIKALEHRSSGKGAAQTVVIEPLNTNDVVKAINKIKPTASELNAKYTEWQQKHGSE